MNDLTKINEGSSKISDVFNGISSLSYGKIGVCTLAGISVLIAMGSVVKEIINVLAEKKAHVKCGIFSLEFDQSNSN